MDIKNTDLFSFNYDSKPSKSHNVKPAVTFKDGKTIKTYIFPDGLKVTNIIKEYGDFDAFEFENYFENTSDSPTKIISDIFDADICIEFERDDILKNTAYQPDPDKDMKIYFPSGSTWTKDEFYCDIDRCEGNSFINHIYPAVTKKYRSNTGRSSENLAPFFDISRQDRGVICAIGWTGQWQCEIKRDFDFVNIKTGTADAHFKLLPGEKIRTSSFVVMNYTGSFDSAHNKWRRFLKKYYSVIGENGRIKNAPFCAGIWGGMSTKSALERIAEIKKNELDFEYIWMDAGWYGDGELDSPDEFEGDWSMYTGDWRVNEKRHPDKLKEVSRAIHDAGMKYILWFEPERVISDVKNVKEHPEYYIFSPFENDKNTLLNLGNEDAWNYCYNTISGIIRELNVDIYRQDFNFDPLKFWDKNDADDRRGITQIKHINGMYRLWDSLLKEFPSLIIDNCASGGRRIDIETLKRSVPLWRSDYQCPANFTLDASQAHGINFAQWIPYSGTGSGREWGDEYRIRSSYACALTTNYTFSERDKFPECEEQINWIKSFSKEYLKVRDYFSCDIYPLINGVAGLDSWCAVQYDRPEENDGIIEVFKREKSPYDSASFTLGSIDEKKTYEFTDADSDEKFILTGKELIENGFNVTIKQKRKAKLFFYVSK